VPALQATHTIVRDLLVGPRRYSVLGLDGTLYAHATTTCLIFEVPRSENTFGSDVDRATTRSCRW
jgi:hypothetical protein